MNHCGFFKLLTYLKERADKLQYHTCHDCDDKLGDMSLLIHNNWVRLQSLWFEILTNSTYIIMVRTVYVIFILWNKNGNRKIWILTLAIDLFKFLKIVRLLWNSFFSFYVSSSSMFLSFFFRSVYLQLSWTNLSVFSVNDGLIVTRYLWITILINRRV